MPGKDLTFPARHSLNVSQRLGEHGGGAYIDLRTIYETTRVRQDRFEQTGILVTDGNNVSAIVRGVLWDDDTNNIISWHLVTNIIHPLRFRRIYSVGTTTGATVLLVGQ